MTKRMSNFERLSLLLQISALPKSKLHSEFDPDFFSEVIMAGHEWAFSWKYQWLNQDEQHELDHVVDEVSDIFDMYHMLQLSGQELNLPPKLTKFGGFDANNDPHYFVADTLIRLLDRYSDVIGACDNSHSIASLSRYRQQLIKYKEISADMGLIGRLLTQAEIEHVL